MSFGSTFFESQSGSEKNEISKPEQEFESNQVINSFPAIFVIFCVHDQIRDQNLSYLSVTLRKKEKISCLLFSFLI